MTMILVAATQPIPAKSQELILPIVQNGYVKDPLHLQTTFRIVNRTAAGIEVTLEAFQNDGKPVRILELFPVPRPGTNTVFHVGPLASIEAFTAGDDPSLDGWVRLSYDGPSGAIVASAEVAVINAPVGPHPICHRPSTEIVSSATFGASQPAQKWSGFGVIRPNRKSSYAIVNPSTTRNATVYLSLMDHSGKFVATQTIELGPQARMRKLLTEFFPTAPAEFMGSMRVTGDLPVCVSAMNMLLAEGKFTNQVVSSPPSGPCIPVISPARNPLTGLCRIFPTPCDVPEGWERVAACN
ncbi:MAG: hypothetical protein HY650_04780 [Acidobacteria bacterium]|nr:hypothetical protein [Acidobacteriota bacterium]